MCMTTNGTKVKQELRVPLELVIVGWLQQQQFINYYYIKYKQI